MAEKQRFYDELACQWNFRSNAEMALGLADFNGHDRKWIDGFESIIHGRNDFSEKNVATVLRRKKNHVLQILGLKRMKKDNIQIWRK